MKVLDLKIDEKKVIEKPVKKQLRLLARVKPHRGHTLFKLKDRKVTIVAEDEIMETLVEFNEYSMLDRKKKIRVEEGAMYTTALNLKNAIKKFKKNNLQVDHE